MFFVTMFGVITLDTNMAIYNRIVVQNVAEVATASAALWQARGCNLLQQLNNLHYQVDQAAYIGESAAFGFCVLGAALGLPPAFPEDFPAYEAACLACDLAPVIDWFQQMANTFIITVQGAIVKATPYWVYGYANAAALGSGADELGGSLVQWIAQDAQGVLSFFQMPPSLSSNVGSFAQLFGDAFNYIPIYALPLNFNPANPLAAVSLHVDLYPANASGQTSYPWYYSFQIANTAAKIGETGCNHMFPSMTEVEGFMRGLSWDGNYGWQDQYYQGNPGYMTWIAGKQQHGELAGLDSLRWLNPNSTSPAEVNYWMDQSNLPMYMGNVNGPGKLTIPAFIAVASSQVEGDPVISNGKVDAAGKLIQVYIPIIGNTPGANLGIFH